MCDGVAYGAVMARGGAIDVIANVACGESMAAKTLVMWSRSQ